MNVLGLDISLRATGVFYRGASTTISPKDGKEIGRRLSEIMFKLRTFTNELAGVDVAVIEGYAFRGYQGATASRLAEVGGCVRLWLYERNVPYIEIAPLTLKKFATGSARADKTLMLAGARDAYPSIANDNEADAYWLATLGESYYNGDELTPNLMRLEWPLKHLRRG